MSWSSSTTRTRGLRDPDSIEPDGKRAGAAEVQVLPAVEPGQAGGRVPVAGVEEPRAMASRTRTPPRAARSRTSAPKKKAPPKRGKPPKRGLPELEQRHLDMIGLGLVALSVFAGFVIWLDWDGGRLGDAGVDGLRWLVGEVHYLAPLAA